MGEGGFQRCVGSYLSALDLHACYVAELADERLVYVGTTADPAQQARTLARRSGAGVTMAQVLWSASDRHSAFLIEAVRDQLAGAEAPRRGWFQVNAEHAADLVRNAAAALGVATATPAELQANAEQAVHAINVLFDQMRTGGGLKAINRAYREERLRLSAQGATAPAYSGWLFNYRQRVCALVAAAAVRADRKGFGRLNPQALVELAPAVLQPV